MRKIKCMSEIESHEIMVLWSNELGHKASFYAFLARRTGGVGVLDAMRSRLTLHETSKRRKP